MLLLLSHTTVRTWPVILARSQKGLLSPNPGTPSEATEFLTWAGGVFVAVPQYVAVCEAEGGQWGWERRGRRVA